MPKRPAPGVRAILFSMPGEAEQKVQLVGIDCAVDARKVGLAIGSADNGRVVVKEITAPRSLEALVEYVAAVVRRYPASLIALDAPLGWPLGLAQAMAGHSAGNPLGCTAHEMARRRTDEVVCREVGRRPLDVGADRIARTAHAALEVLANVRARAGVDVPLAWTPGAPRGAAAIEVYPAGTLASRGLDPRGYKKGPAARDARARLTQAVRAELELSEQIAEAMVGSDHALDAALCVLAAADCLRCDVLGPEDDARARREGWIWVRPRRDGHSSKVFAPSGSRGSS